MIDTNYISYLISVGLIIIGVIAFLFSNLRIKYLNAAVISSVGLRLVYWTYIELIKINITSLVAKIIMHAAIGMFILGVLGSSISILLRNDGRKTGGKKE